MQTLISCSELLCYPKCTGRIKQRQKQRQQEKSWQLDDTSLFSLSRVDLWSWPCWSPLPYSEIWLVTTVQERGQDQKALANIHNLFIRNQESHFMNFILTGSSLCSHGFFYLMVTPWGPVSWLGCNLPYHLHFASCGKWWSHRASERSSQSVHN